MAAAKKLFGFPVIVKDEESKSVLINLRKRRGEGWNSVENLHIQHEFRKNNKDDNNALVKSPSVDFEFIHAKTNKFFPSLLKAFMKTPIM